MHGSLFAVLQRLQVVFAHLYNTLCRLVVPVESLTLYQVVAAVGLVQHAGAREIEAVDTAGQVKGYRQKACVVKKSGADAPVPQVEASHIVANQAPCQQPKPRLHPELDQLYQFFFLHVFESVVIEPVAMVWVKQDLQIDFVQSVSFSLLTI